MFDSYVKLPAGNLAPLNLVGIASNPLLHCRDLAMQKTKKKTQPGFATHIGTQPKKTSWWFGTWLLFPHILD